MKKFLRVGFNRALLILPFLTCMGAGGYDHSVSNRTLPIPVPKEAINSDYFQYPGYSPSPSSSPRKTPTRTPTRTPTPTPTDTPTPTPTPTPCIQEIIARICGVPEGGATANCNVLGADTECTVTPSGATIEFMTCGGNCTGEVQYQFSTGAAPAQLNFDCGCLKPCESLPEGSSLGFTIGCGDMQNFEDTFYAKGTCSLARCGFTGEGSFSCTSTGEPGFNFNLSRRLFDSCNASCYIGNDPQPYPSAFGSASPWPSGVQCGGGLEIDLPGGIFCKPHYDAPVDNPGDGTFKCDWGVKF